MKLLSLVCLLAILCNAYALLDTIGTEVDEALKILRRAKTEVQVSIINLGEIKTRLFQIVEYQIEKNYEEDVKNIQKPGDNRIRRITEKLEKAKKNRRPNSNRQHCLERIAMDVKTTTSDTLHKVGQCLDAAKRQWNEVKERFENVIMAGKRLLNEEEIIQTCNRPDRMEKANCIVNRITADIPTYKKDIFRVFEDVENLQSAMSKQKLCNNTSVFNIRRAAKNWDASIANCTKKTRHRDQL